MPVSGRRNMRIAFSPLWRLTVAWRHRSRDNSTQHRRFPIGNNPLSPLVFEIFSHKDADVATCMHTDTHVEWH